MAEINLKNGTCTLEDGKKLYWNGDTYQDHPISKEEQCSFWIDWYDSQKELVGKMYEKQSNNAVTAAQTIEANEWYEKQLTRLKEKYIQGLLSI